VFKFFCFSAPDGVNILSVITTPTFITIFIEPMPGVLTHEVKVSNAKNSSDYVLLDPGDFNLSHVVV